VPGSRDWEGIHAVPLGDGNFLRNLEEPQFNQFEGGKDKRRKKGEGLWITISYSNHEQKRGWAECRKAPFLGT